MAEPTCGAPPRTDAALERLARHPGVAAASAVIGPGAQGWVVGGAVRDVLLGRSLADIDVVVRGADPAVVARTVARRLGAPAFELSREFGQWRVDARHGERETPGFTLDVAPLQGASLVEDLRRRDFTVNAIAVALSAPPQLEDPLGGLDDLRRGALVLASEEAFRDDPVRLLRLARFRAELAFEPTAEVLARARADAELLAGAAPERLLQELRKTIAATGVLAGLELMDRASLTEHVLPELAALRGVEQSQFHHLDVYDHTFEVLRQLLLLERRLADFFGSEVAEQLARELARPLADDFTRGQAVRLAALLHDIGKPRTRAVRADGRVTFIGHDEVGAEMTLALCRRLRTSTTLARFLAEIVRNHLALGFLVHERPLPRRRVYDYLRRCEPVEVEVTYLSCADRLATRGRNAERAIAAHLELARELMAAALAWRRAGGAPRPPLRGDELARVLGIAPGPLLGELLEELRAAVYAGEVAGRQEAIAHARRRLEATASK